MHKIQLELRKYAKKDKITIYKNFFKTGKGEYGEGDEFIGVTIPDTRKVAMSNVHTSFNELVPILKSKIHEDRMCALLLLVYKYETSDESTKKKIYDFYLKNIKSINNWDLVDTSAPYIIGEHLEHKNKSILYKLAKSSNLWERRISIIATFQFIKNNQFDETFNISEILLNDKHDLIHKAVGWMLREIGKRNLEAEEEFLKKYYKEMPRTMLRYAVERFQENKRKAYLNGEI